MTQGPESAGGALIPYIDSAQDEGVLTAKTRELLERPDVQNMLTLTSGTPVEDIAGDELTIITLLIDDSGSMEHLADAVRRGHQRFLDRLRLNAPNPDATLVTTQLINGARAGRQYRAAQADESNTGSGKVINPYLAISRPAEENDQPSVVALDEINYIPYGRTPLYERTIEVIGSVLLKAQEAKEHWKSVRTFTIIMTDGFDSTDIAPETVAELIIPFGRSGRNIVGAVGFGLEEAFRETFTKMGIDSKWQLTADSTDQELDRILGLITSGATLVATDEEFDKTRDGGFLALPPGK